MCQDNITPLKRSVLDVLLWQDWVNITCSDKEAPGVQEGGQTTILQAGPEHVTFEPKLPTHIPASRIAMLNVQQPTPKGISWS